MSYLTYATINSLEEFGFIAGTDYLITFNVFEENGITPLDMGGATIKWALAPYGQTSYNVLQLDGVITDVGVFTVTVPSASTETFSGKYIHQVIITSFAGSEYRPGQGVLLISPRIAAPSLEPSYSITGTTAGLIAETIHAAPTKVTPVDADEIPLWNSVGSVLANVNWANLKATLKTYFDVLYAGVVNTLVYKGVIDCSTNPNYPAADAGHVYVISVTGKIGGASGVSVDAGDIAICNTDGTASGTQAAVGAYWNIVEKNIAGAVTGPATATDGNLALFDGTTGKIIKLGSPPPANEAGAASNFITAYNSATGAFSKAQPTWANIDKTVSSIADITTKSHTALSDIGTNTHAQIDTFIGTTVPATYLPLAGGTMVGNVIYNDNVSVLLGTGSDGELFHDGTNTYFQNNTGHIYIENDTSDGDIIFKVNDGGVDTTVMTIDGATSNVGIGTTAPSNALHIKSSGTEYGQGGIRLENSANTNYFDILAAGSMYFGYNGATKAELNTAGILALGSYIGAETIKLNVSGSSFFNGGNVGIGTISPTNLLSLTGQSAKTIWSERNTTAATAGQNLTIRVGGAVAGGTNLGGGSLILAGGTSTGTGTSTVLLQTSPAGSTGTADNALATMLEITGNKIGFFAQTPVVRQTELTDELTTITHTAPGTPDYAIQNFTQTSPFGFVTADEANTVLSVIANLQTRVNELETKLTAYGLLIDAD